MKVSVRNRKVEVKPIYGVIFWSTKVIILFLSILFVLDFGGYIDFKAFVASLF